jgi:hypothetical protein
VIVQDWDPPFWKRLPTGFCFRRVGMFLGLQVLHFACLDRSVEHATNVRVACSIFRKRGTFEQLLSDVMTVGRVWARGGNGEGWRIRGSSVNFRSFDVWCSYCKLPKSSTCFEDSVW